MSLLPKHIKTLEIENMDGEIPSKHVNASVETHPGLP